MLVLSRKNRESVVVGGSDGFDRLLKVTVLDIRAGQVRLGFEVDRDVPSIGRRCGNASMPTAGRTARQTSRSRRRDEWSVLSY